MASSLELQEKEGEQPPISNFKIIVDKNRVRIDFTIRTEISKKCYNKI